MKKLLIVDGNSILNRAFYGVRPLTTRDGRNTNAIFGFINMLYKQLQELSPDYAAIAFDLKAKTFRHLKCDYYKANRKGMPDELVEQLEPAKKIAELMGFKLITLEGYEADDILGTLSTLSNKDTEAYIMTGDRDSYQLITDTSFVLYVSTKDTSVYNKDSISNSYGGLTPPQLIDVKALMGDTSDNIPGVAGIGEKTAVGLVATYGSLDGVYTALEQGDPGIKGAVKTKLENSRDSAYESRFLAEICKTAPVGLALSDMVYNGMDKKALFDICTDLELNSIIKRLGLDELPFSDMPMGNMSLFDTEPKSLPCIHTDKAECHGLTAVFADEQEKKLYYSSNAHEDIYCVEATTDNLTAVFENPNVKTIVHDLKDLYIYLHGYGISLKNCVFDVLLGSYVADPSKVITKDGLHSFAGITGVDTGVPEQKAILCLKSIKKAYSELEPVIAQNGQEKLLYDIEMPVSYVLGDMQLAGFKLNCEKLREFGQMLETRLNARRESIYGYAGCEFNINSTKQLAEILFDKLELPSFKKTKSGYSTDAETLEKLRPYHPIINEILEYRLVAKLKSTYTDALINSADQNGRLHTVFKQALTLTGRLSSAEPNLQNIPIRTEEGRELRRFFEAKSEDYVLIDADYSQIELRLMAAMSGDSAMIETYRLGKDIHTSTASQVFGVPEALVTSELRKKAKAVNFGIIYGISDYSLAGDLHVTKKEAGDYIKNYFAKFPEIKAYLERAKESAREKGYSETLYARRRYIPEISAKNKNLQGFGERVAMNAPIQGTAADIIKIAMINVSKRLKKECRDSYLVLQVHDELIVEAHISEKEKAFVILKEEMENAASLSVSLMVEAGMGSNWYEAHE